MNINAISAKSKHTFIDDSDVMSYLDIRFKKMR